VQLGIRVEFIEPGHPEQNAVHERMHRTLKDDTCCPPKWTHNAQQRRFDDWRNEFNYVRPHEALKMRCPAEVYQASAIAYHRQPKPFCYPGHFEVRRVKKAGQIVLHSVDRFIGHAFRGIDVGLEPIRFDQFLVHAGPLVIGMISTKTKAPMRKMGSKQVSRSFSIN
jgi:hypothetical protein